MREARKEAPKRRHPRFPVRAPALLELVSDRGRRKVVRGQLSDVSLTGVGLRADAHLWVVKPGVSVTIRFFSDGRTFSLPGDVVWTRDSAEDHATLGVRLSLKKAPPDARRLFRRWTKEVAKARGADGALPACEQVECRLAALMGELDVLMQQLAAGEELDETALREIDTAAERLQNAVTTLELRASR